jgi:ADP-ribose pyrophosphatase YjhB (NUDIX family)
MQNYKVFINNDLIFFEQNANFKSISNRYSDYQMIAEDSLPLIIEKINIKKFSGKYCIATESPEILFKKFSQNFEILEAAGGLVFNSRNELLMIHRFGRWDFPKGHLEKNELVAQAAIREVTEETAAQNLTITQKLPCTYHMYDNHGKMVIKRTHWYLMKTNYSNKLIPQLEEDILAAVWVPDYAIPEYIDKSYPALKELVEELFELNILIK